MKKTVVINIAGLTPELIGEETPGLKKFAAGGALAGIETIVPAVTCSVQSTFLTGQLPAQHGIVGNGWYGRDDGEIKFWRQSNELVQGPKIWDMAKSRDPKFTCANLFWWYNMHSRVDYGITPRPMYPADGRKIPDIYTKPPDIRFPIQSDLGPFPLFDFWGPKTSITSSRWITGSAQWIDKKFNPTLTLIYLPHLDYCLQRWGPDIPKIKSDLNEIDGVTANLVDFYDKRGAQIIMLSEYGITRAPNPIHLNRVLRQSGHLKVREELGLEILDTGASSAFAVADHQVAHIYIPDLSQKKDVKDVLRGVAGIEFLWDGAEKDRHGLNHPRAGDLIAVADKNSWFTYYYWLDDRKAPDFARTVDIHRKPGYDPAELFFDPKIRFPSLKVGYRLAQKILGFRCLMDIVPLDAALVQGSHGRVNERREQSPVFISNNREIITADKIRATDVCRLILKHLDLEIPCR